MTQTDHDGVPAQPILDHGDGKQAGTLTTCPYCGVGCGVALSAKGGSAVVEGDTSHPANFGRLCVKGTALAETLGHHGRLTMPRVDGHETSWEQALDTLAERLLKIREAAGPGAIAGYLSGQLLTEDYYVANKLFKGFIGTPHLDTNSRLCMASAVASYKRTFGADAVPCNYEDLEEAELVVLVGSNLAWNHPVLYQRLRLAKSRNPLLRVVVIDPRVTDSCEVADLYLGLRPGSDAALFNGLLAWMARHQRLDRVYLQRHTDGSDEALKAALVDAPDIDAVAAACDLDPERLETFYYWFATQLHVVTLYSQGVNQSTSGTDKCQAILNCHLAGGKIGLPGAGPFSITGQPNAMGGREVGGLANQLAAHMDYHAPGARERVARFWSTQTVTATLPEGPGYKAIELFEALERGEIQALWIIATNPLVSLPDSDRVRAAIARCPLVIVSECMEDTELVALADIVLPASGWSEKDGTVTNSERRISRQRGLLPPPGEARHDWWILCQVAARLGLGEAFAYTHPAEIFDEHARLSGLDNDGQRAFDISGLAGLTRQQYDALAPIQWPVTRSAPRGTPRLFEDGRFFTETGRARLWPVYAKAPQQTTSQQFPLRLNSGRVRDQWHTMTRTARASRLMNHRAEPFVEVHRDDAAALGLVDQALASIRSPTGEMRARVRVAPGQRRGEVFVPIHWTRRFSHSPQAGALFGGVTDPLSGQPETKHGAVMVSPLVHSWEATLVLGDDALSTMSDSPRDAMASLVKGTEYWTRVPMAAGERWQLAGDLQSASRDWLAWARQHLPGEVGPVLQDPSGCRWRLAGFDQGRLCWWLMVGPVNELPGLGWLSQRLTEAAKGEVMAQQDRRRVLAGCDDGASDQGPIVCSCHQVGRTPIQRAIRAGDDSVEALGARLACGTQCGSCLPELKSLVEEEKSRGAIKPPQPVSAC
ncbi:nitrate reductase [Halomonas sp. DP5Y7-2]|uniref:nitrate reductase n=1 Tax=Halomonas sp. DP5Y7-2 TaxID=2859076 RepID=UPI001C99C25A|nr:nitrate reductase [Halomonas sp. DP5Y7-2]MBY5982668.1 nitrate reductase [Halomonas sp. DP5Y7-2]